jgi:hypothetical protein
MSTTQIAALPNPVEPTDEQLGAQGVAPKIFNTPVAWRSSKIQTLWIGG